MFVVAGVSGNTGKVVAETLLSAGQSVRVFVRSAEKAAAFRARGAEVAEGTLDDAAALGRALRGARGAYLLLPPDYASQDLIADRRRTTQAIAQAVTASGVPHVAFLSSIAAQLREGTGPIRVVAEAERMFSSLASRGVSTRFTFVRAAYFMDNLAGAVPVARAHGALHCFFDPKKPIPMVSTKDIGLVGARALMEGPAEGRASIVELEGPRPVSLAEVAAELATLLGRSVEPVRVAAPEVADTLIKFGLSKNAAELLAEMNRSIDDGTVAFEGNGTRHVRGDTDVRSVLRSWVAG